MKRLVEISVAIQVEIDESKFTEEFMQGFRQTVYNFHSLDEHIEHIAQLSARGLLSHEFTGA